jgi:C4-type Zn-finger protein
MSTPEYLPPFTSEKPCPRCGELLHWPDIHNEIEGPYVGYNTRTGKVWDVILTRFCISCGYREKGFVSINQDPVWREQKEEEQS